MPSEFLGALLAPSVLISAAGLLILGAVNRYGRIMERIRGLNELILEAEDDVRSDFIEERGYFFTRTKRAWLALCFLYSAVCAFVLSSLLLGGAALTGAPPIQHAAVGIILVGVVLMACGAVCLVSEATITLGSAERDIRRTDRLLERRRAL